MNTAITSYKRLCVNGEIENNHKQEELILRLTDFLRGTKKSFLDNKVCVLE